MSAYLSCHLQQWLGSRGVALGFTIHTEDCILANATVLDDSPQLFPDCNGNEQGFDIVVMNPPYFKLPRSDPRAQAAATVVHGQPNIYAIFLALGAALLRPEGELIAITPGALPPASTFTAFANTSSR